MVAANQRAPITKTNLSYFITVKLYTSSLFLFFPPVICALTSFLRRFSAQPGVTCLSPGHVAPSSAPCYCLIIYSVILHSLSPPSLTLNVLTEQKRTFQPEVTCFTGARIYLYSTNIKAEHMDTCDPGFFTGASFLYLK